MVSGGEIAEPLLLDLHSSIGCGTIDAYRLFFLGYFKHQLVARMIAYDAGIARVGQFERWFADIVVDPSGYNRAVRVTVEEADDYLIAHVGEKHGAPAVAG